MKIRQKFCSALLFSAALSVFFWRTFDTIGHRDVVILDGGMGSEIKRRGLPFNETDWSAKILMSNDKGDFEALKQIHIDYINSGAKIITTNSYGVCLIIGKTLFLRDGRKLVEKAILAAREAVKESGKVGLVLIAGSASPLFGSYSPNLFDAKIAKELYSKTVDPLVESKDVDLILFETLSSIEESVSYAEYVNECMLKSGVHKPYWVSFTLNDFLVNGEPRLRSGESIAEIIKLIQAVSRLGYAHPEAILFNCSQPEIITSALKVLKKVLNKSGIVGIKMGAYANRFVLEKNIRPDIPSKLRDLSPNDYLKFAKQWNKSGATIIGGCCGIAPQYIKTLSNYYS